jgi:hypothetical protein
MKQFLSKLLPALQWADSYIAVEPYEHSSDEEADAHYLLRDAISVLNNALNASTVDNYLIVYSEDNDNTIPNRLAFSLNGIPTDTQYHAVVYPITFK